MNTHIQRKQGFTIIEVVLVLAIAALIFLMIFVALPALQRNQRDTARKNDAGVVSSALGTYRSNNSGSLPTSSTFGDFRTQYLTDKLSQYGTDKVVLGNAASSSVDDLVVSLGYDCNGTASARVAAVYVRLENADASYCTPA